MTVVHRDAHIREQFSKITVGLGLVLCICLGLAFCVFLVELRLFCSCIVWFCCTPVLGLVSSVLHQEIGWEERLFCVEWHLKTLTQSISQLLVGWHGWWRNGYDVGLAI